MKKTNLLAGLALACLALGGCAEALPAVRAIGELALPRLLDALAPELADRLAPEVRQAARILQSSGAVAVERLFENRFEATTAAIARGDVVSAAETNGRMQILKRLRRINDLSQVAQQLSPAARAELEAARRATDAAYSAVIEALDA